MKIRLIHGSCEDVLKKLPDNSIHSLVTDPPAGIAFMGKEWDKDKGGRNKWIEWLGGVVRECIRVMKPGAHGLVWSIPRTSHWTATALEDVGFEIRDCITALFGSGFPKSMDISKQLDKEAGVERKVVGKRKHPTLKDSSKLEEQANAAHGNNEWSREWNMTAPTTSEAQQWNGWGTALKPACEFWILIRKPLSEKTIAKNILKWGVGGINIDDCRIGEDAGWSYPKGAGGIYSHEYQKESTIAKDWNNFSTKEDNIPIQANKGRFPSHLILDEEVVEMLDEQSGELKSGKMQAGTERKTGLGYHGGLKRNVVKNDTIGDKGGASRFFYCAKSSRSEREKGLLGSVPCAKCKQVDTKTHKNDKGKDEKCIRNDHPTVKPTRLMEYLIRLITPPNGIVLDPFMGSGSTGVACVKEGFDFIGIEQDERNVLISKSRIAHAKMSNHGNTSGV